MFVVTILHADREDTHSDPSWVSFADAIAYVDGLDNRGIHVVLRNTLTGSVHGFPSHLFGKEQVNA